MGCVLLFSGSDLAIAKSGLVQILIPDVYNNRFLGPLVFFLFWPKRDVYNKDLGGEVCFLSEWGFRGKDVEVRFWKFGITPYKSSHILR